MLDHYCLEYNLMDLVEEPQVDINTANDLIGISLNDKEIDKVFLEK